MAVVVQWLERSVVDYFKIGNFRKTRVRFSPSALIL
jgi:hypothetical protein